MKSLLYQLELKLRIIKWKLLLKRNFITENNKKKSFNKTFKTQSKTSKKIFIKIFEGEYVWENHLLWWFTVGGLNNDNIIEIKMILQHNSIITVIMKIKGEKEQKLIISKSDFFDEIEVKNYKEKL